MTDFAISFDCSFICLFGRWFLLLCFVCLKNVARKKHSQNNRQWTKRIHQSNAPSNWHLLGCIATVDDFCQNIFFIQLITIHNKWKEESNRFFSSIQSEWKGTKRIVIEKSIETWERKRLLFVIEICASLFEDDEYGFAVHENDDDDNIALIEAAI